MPTPDGKAQVFLTLDAEQQGMLDELAKAKGASKAGVLRTALRLYARVAAEVQKGAKIYVEGGDENRTEIFF